MTGTEAIEMFDWVKERWPRFAWKAVEVQSLAADTAGMDSADVWDAMFRLHRQGRQYPPSVSEVVGLARELARGNALARGPKALPVGDGWDFSFAEWRAAHGFDSRDEAVEGYAAGMRPCTGNKQCQVCRELVDRRAG